MDIEFLTKHNPWWKNKEELLNDTKVSTALNKNNPYIPSLFPKHEGIFSVRGPRQVGKTTAIKLFIRTLLFESKRDPREIMYLPCDILGDFGEIVKAAEIHKEWILRFGLKNSYVIFDEITFVKEWHRAVKYLADNAVCRMLIFTGSLASDIKHGTERFPGRGIKKLLCLPLSFSEYARLFGSAELKKSLIGIKPLALEEIGSGNAIKKLSALMPFIGELNRLLENYLATGGFLLTSYQFYEERKITEERYEDYVNWILGDLSKAEKSEYFFREIISAITSKYGSEMAFHSIAKETSIGSHKTVAEYLELLNNFLLLNTLHKIDMNKKSTVFRKQKKFYFLDPFLFNAFAGYVNGRFESYITEKNKPFIIEGIVMEHLRRKSGQQENVWYYKDRQGEVDFVIRSGSMFQAVEVKWQEHVSDADFAHYSIFKKPLILSKKDIAEGKAVIAPVSVFLALI